MVKVRVHVSDIPGRTCQVKGKGFVGAVVTRGVLASVEEIFS